MPPPTPTPTPTPKKRKRAASAATRLTDAQTERLVAIMPKGIAYSRHQFETWLAVKAPLMAAYGKRDLYRTARNWWRRVTHEEVTEAEAAAENARLLARGNGKDPPPEPAESSPQPVADLFAEDEP